MKTITFKVDNDKDFKLLIKLAERLGISIENKEKKEKEWNYMGAANLEGQMDKTNIRDFAND
jgi:hypothetical protein